jgi:hypothetical protein
MEDLGMRRNTSGRLALLWVVGLLITPAVSYGQYPVEQAPPDPSLPLPLHSNRIEDGGPYFAADFLFWLQSNHIKRQTVAVRGFADATASITSQPGTFVGTGQDPAWLWSPAGASATASCWS